MTLLLVLELEHVGVKEGAEYNKKFDAQYVQETDNSASLQQDDSKLSSISRCQGKGELELHLANDRPVDHILDERLVIGDKTKI